jgi:hypothetical protein
MAVRPAPGPVGAVRASLRWSALPAPLRRTLRLTGLIAVTRLAGVVAAVIAAHRVPLPNAARYWSSTDPVLDALTRWDALWLIRIARDGYAAYSLLDTTAFFPGYPLLMGATADVTGLDPAVAGIAVSLVSLLIGLSLLERYITIDRGPAAARATSLVMCAVLPTSFFFGVPYTESTFVMSVAGALLFARRGRFGAAAAFAALATLTRLNGIVVVAAIAVEAWRGPGGRPARRRRLALCALGASGIAAYMAFLAIRFGEPLLFLDAQRLGWSRSLAIPGSQLLHGALHIDNSRIAVEVASSLLAIGLTIVGWRRMRPGERTLVVGSLVILLGSTELQSMARLVLPLLPLWIVVGGWLAEAEWRPRRRTIAWSTLIVLGTAGHAWVAYLYASGQFIA